MARIRAFAIAAVVLAFVVPQAQASQLVGVNATDVQLSVDREGKALVVFRSGGLVHRVVAHGAVNALPPTRTREQVSFAFRSTSSAVANACTPASPPLHWLVTACRAPDGSFWALQSWQRGLPNYGAPATAMQAARELRLSHWTGDVPQLTIRFGWAYHRFQQLYGVYTFDGHGVFGFNSTRTGVPEDTFGRNVYVDTLESAYGPGWRRENSFLTHTGAGGFCYGLYPHGPHPSGTGKRYRATAIGPGVAPDAAWEGPAPAGPYDRAADTAADADMRALLGADPLCPAR
jgi:hypothetical protein